MRHPTEARPKVPPVPINRRNMKIIYTILIILLVAVQGKAQEIPGYSASEVNEAYGIINLHHPGGGNIYLYKTAMGSATEIYGEMLTYQVLNEGNREKTPSGVLAITPYVDFDTLLTADQKNELVNKFERLPVLDLDAERLTTTVISQEDIKDKKSTGEEFGISHISFPIVQEGRGGVEYAIVADNVASSTGFSLGGRMHVYRKIDGEWKYFCVVSIGL